MTDDNKIMRFRPRTRMKPKGRQYSEYQAELGYADFPDLDAAPKRDDVGRQPRRRLHQSSGKLFLAPTSREMGHFHHVAGPYLLRYAQEASWREDARRVDNGAQVRRVAELALKRGPSVDFSGYYQRHVKAA